MNENGANSEAVGLGLKGAKTVQVNRPESSLDDFLKDVEDSQVVPRFHDSQQNISFSPDATKRVINEVRAVDLLQDSNRSLDNIFQSLEKEHAKTQTPIDDWTNLPLATSTMLCHLNKKYDEFFEFKRNIPNPKLKACLQKNGHFKDFVESYPGKDNEVKHKKIASGEYFGQLTKIGDKKEGLGILLDTDGSLYEGYFYNDMKSGFGNLYEPSGQFYSGKWHKDKLHGDGTYISPNTEVYRGNWVNGMKEGFGEERTTARGM